VDTRAEIIRAEGVTKRFGQQVAVNNVSYLLHENEVAGIIGSNGAGKTTFFRPTKDRSTTRAKTSPA
jgi:ABC-type multidrug transport system ATPase subunit